VPQRPRDQPSGSLIERGSSLPDAPAVADTL